MKLADKIRTFFKKIKDTRDIWVKENVWDIDEQGLPVIDNSYNKYKVEFEFDVPAENAERAIAYFQKTFMSKFTNSVYYSRYGMDIQNFDITILEHVDDIYDPNMDVADDDFYDEYDTDVKSLLKVFQDKRCVK